MELPPWYPATAISIAIDGQSSRSLNGPQIAGNQLKDTVSRRDNLDSRLFDEGSYNSSIC